MSNSSRPPALLNYIGTVQLRHMVAGISGGVVSTLLLHPLDLLKIRSDTAGAGPGLVANIIIIISRFAVDDGRAGCARYSNIRNAMTSIVRSEGLRGLYRGVTPNVLTAGSSWGSYFLFYQVCGLF